MKERRKEFNAEKKGLWRAASSEPRIEQAQNSRPESAHIHRAERVERRRQHESSLKKEGRRRRGRVYKS